jgi:hypothetical protein
METLIPAPRVDALPARFWWLTNLYRAFGRTVHLCVGGGGPRTAEIGDREVAHGLKPFEQFHAAPNLETHWIWARQRW